MIIKRGIERDLMIARSKGNWISSKSIAKDKIFMLVLVLIAVVIIVTRL